MRFLLVSLLRNTAVLGACLIAQLLVSRPLAREPVRPRGRESVTLKDSSAASDAAGTEATVLGTLVQTHTGERVLVSDTAPSSGRFDALLQDRVTGSEIAMDARLLGLLRTLLRNHPRSHIELVSGYRSEKLNEMMRKKGHHVASHSQHSLGHACDFRLVLEGHARGENPRDVERELRALGWDGGIGTYFGAHDWFVHADVGKNRRWNG